MKIAVMGLGGVGGYFGGKIARKYSGSPEHRVIFIARGPHLAAIRDKGLTVKAMEGDSHGKARPGNGPSGRGRAVRPHPL